MNFKPERTNLKVLGTYRSKHPDKTYDGDDYFVTVKVPELEVTPEGIVGDRHHGYTTISGGRFGRMYQNGTDVRNNRQWSATSPEEIKRIASNLGVEERLTPELLGVNLLLSGIESLAQLPPMSHILFSPHAEFGKSREEDVMLVIYGEALPCTIAGKALVEPLGEKRLENEFPKAAIGCRALTGWVEKGGIIRPDYNAWVLTPTGRD